MLKVIGLTKEYDKKIILNNLSFSLPEGAIASLQGRNGIGKTTLLNILGGISRSSGDIFLGQISKETNFKEYLAVTSVIPNIPFLYEYLTVSEMIDLVISLIDDDIVAKSVILKNTLIDKFKISDYRDVLIKNLSLGTKQKVAFIVNFISEPKLILIDEPFVNFDKESMINVIEFIKEYTVEKKSIVIFSTHAQIEEITNIITHKIQIQDASKITVTMRST